MKKAKMKRIKGRKCFHEVNGLNVLIDCLRHNLIYHMLMFDRDIYLDFFYLLSVNIILE